MRARVAWHEGMHLAPQHFQQQQRAAEETMHATMTQLVAHPWGVLRLRLDQAALGRGVAALAELEALLPDGLAIAAPTADPLPSPLALAEHWPTDATAQWLFLVVASGDGSTPLVRVEGDLAIPARTRSRYRAVRVPRADDMTGGEPRPVLLAEKQLRLALEGMRDPEEVALPLARLTRDARGRVALDDTASPPALQLGGSALLAQGLARLVAILEEKSHALAQGRAADVLANYGPLEIARIWLHHTVQTGLAPLAHLALTPAAHPEQLYLQLVRLAGALSTFGAHTDAARLAPYRHEAPHDWFPALERHIRTHLDLVLPTGCLVVPMAAHDALLHRALIDDPRAFATTQWYLGVRTTVAERVVREQAPTLLKLCAMRDVVALVQSAASGLALEPVPHPPAAIAPRAGTTYFRILRREPAWSACVDTADLGAYVPALFADAELELRILLTA
ncbi:MAG: type VI secretion system baseplate subunit TssK [Gemmatimonadaceae bacterium]|nr:type VI secretion system baseplate subunit TssK [Gemmatimonadaceae bacterium]